MADFYIKKNDRRENLIATLKGSDGTAIDLTAANGITFLMASSPTATPKISAAAAKTDAANGIVTYSWAANDTNTAGKFYGEFEIDWGSSITQTVPTRGHIEIEIIDDISA